MAGSILIYLQCFRRHFLLCIYGTVVIALILAGRLKELRVIYILTGILDVCRHNFHRVAELLIGANMNISLISFVMQFIMALKIHLAVWLRMLYK